jgi:choline-sulfatase
MTRKIFLRSLALAVVVGIAASGGCRRAAAPGASPGARPSVLLVTIDTLRADRVGCYGYPGASTPVLDALAARGARFATAVTHVPLTGPAHASILTGLTPLGHGFRENAGFALPETARTGAFDFRRAGYRTAAFVSAFPLDRRFGFDRGFETYDDHLPKGNDPRRTPYVERFADATTDAALRWLEAPGKDGPFFLWVHYYDPHAPYEPPRELAERFRATPYDGEVAFADRELGRLLAALDARGALARTVVVAMSDHGEGLGEHGEGTHGLFLYDSTLRVPLIVAGPGIAEGRVATTVARGIDVLPTILDLAGIPGRPEIEGRSLRPAIEGRDMGDAPLYAETIYPQREFGWAPLYAWRTATHKVIEAPTPELYDLAKDPGETQNQAAHDPARFARLQEQLQAALARPVEAAAAATDPESAERLRALGYVAGGGGAKAAPGARLRDPKDGQRLMPALNRGMSVVRTDPATAIRDLTSVLAEDPGLLMARRSLAVAYTAAHQYDRAILELRRVEKEAGLSAEDAIVLGDNLRFSGRLDESMAVLEKVARDNPRFAQPWLSMAEVHVKKGRLADAATAYGHALSITPDHVEALRGLGDLAMIEQDAAAAERRYGRILEIDPADAGALSKLGVVRMRTGRPEEAIALFRRATLKEPKNGEALLYLAGALASTGHPADAVPFFERALDAGQRNPMTLNGLGLTRMALGDEQGAANAYRESLRLDPKQPEVARALARLR